MAKPVRLVKMQVKNVAAVGRPANGRKWLMVKSADTLSTDQGDSTMNEQIKPDASALTKMGQTIAAMFGRASGADEATILELEKSAAGETAPVIPVEVKTRLSKAEAENADLKTRLEKAEAATAKLAEEASLRTFAEEVAGYASIGLDPAKDAVLLKSVSEKLDPAHAERIRELFKAAVAQVAAGALYKEVGSAGTGSVAGSASEQVEREVAALMAKSEKLTVGDAQASVFRANPALYEKWRVESSVRG